ncbi:PREDICTED: uncharacterized protein LOC105141695 [Populus euphratica]|uniref:Uncharacterized protein LOC105117798 n=1 Tax=Populus euphratica TaxID=75702 RepID=A0AAJ6TMW5_POPEU|nr:PREDICTED: uncharacterized protein LOC105117798 [Populus euphratica]XP_011013861.1 PREDICTED: uncharacterized protein LOC105117798 [Populus euphratica]XP_011047302.1 PREDICTED: uncharacterized protein LOC105141695 [Populus euphratica]XP_011047303.1 PREDICTED: uncharacterized protein LOC105141695 [Populus euphratica]XP_011047304.1 PREDICTED: uncharacterized protein LOC105141695 [Populus euphratica]
MGVINAGLGNHSPCQTCSEGRQRVLVHFTEETKTSSLFNKLAMESSVQHFPVTHKECSVVIKGNKTDVVISGYDDHFLVIATQIGSMGTILHARKDESLSIHPTFNVSVIFGKRDEPMLVACARQLIEHISTSGSSKPLVLSLGLQDHSSETLRGVVSAVTANRVW